MGPFGVERLRRGDIKAAGGWIAKMKNAKLQVNYERDAMQASIYASGFAKIGAFVILGIAFVPQWTPTTEG